MNQEDHKQLTESISKFMSMISKVFQGNIARLSFLILERNMEHKRSFSSPKIKEKLFSDFGKKDNEKLFSQHQHLD